VRRREGVLEWLWNVVQKGERRIIRVMVLSATVLVIMQLSVVKDPLQFYIMMASKIETPPLDLPSPVETLTAKQAQTWQVTLRATPAAPVRVLQNGKLIATLVKGIQAITVQTGQIQLDGKDIPCTVQVQVIKKDDQLLEPHQNQALILRGDIQTINVNP